MARPGGRRIIAPRLQGPRRYSFEAPRSDDEIVWVDLDLDFEVAGDEMALQDEAQFHDHTRTIGYPDQVVGVRGRAAPRSQAQYTNGDWPFDGSMAERWTPPDSRSTFAPRRHNREAVGPFSVGLLGDDRRHRWLFR